jgi:hypothetical protein
MKPEFLKLFGMDYNRVDESKHHLWCFAPTGFAARRLVSKCYSILSNGGSHHCVMANKKGPPNGEPF